MNYPTDAIEACEALAHPLPHPPDMHTRSIDVSHFAQHDHGTKVDTKHPGPITMAEPEERTRWDVYGAVLLIGILCGFGLVFAGGQIAELVTMAGR